MRITALHIDGFGILRGTLLTDLPPGLLVIQGDNEAGKSTLLWFIRGMLFGFPDGRSKDPRYLPADGGTPGGRLEVVAGNGDLYTISRRGTRSGGEVAVSDASHVDCGEETLRHLLGSTTAQLYRNVYAFSLAELQTIDSLQAEGVKGAIYGATVGTALLALPKALKKIDGRLEDIFRPRGQKQEINRRLVTLDSITESLRHALNGITQYDEACRELANTQARMVEVQSHLSGLRSEAVTVDAYLQLWPEWIKLQQCTADLQGLSVVVKSFPENGLGRLETANERLRGHQERLRDLEDKRTALRREIDNVEADPQMIAQTEAIYALTERRTQYIATREDLPLKGQKRAGSDAEIKGFLRRLGPDWTEGRVRRTECSLATREAIRGNDQTLGAAGAEVARAEQDVVSRQEAHRVAVRDEQAAKRKVEQFGDLEMADEKLVRELQTGRELFREAANDLPTVQAELTSATARAEEGIREIDARWTVDDVRRFDVSIAAQRKIQEFARRFDEGRKALDEANTRRVAAAEMLRGSREQHAALVDEMQALPEGTDQEEVARRKAALIALKTALQERAQHVSEMRYMQSRLDDKRKECTRLRTDRVSSFVLPWWLPLLIVLISAALFGAGVAIGKRPEAAVVAAVVATVGVLSFVWSRASGVTSDDGRSAYAAVIGQVGQEIGVLEDQLEKLQGTNVERDEAIGECARALSLSTPPIAAEIAEAEEALERARDALGRRERLEGELRKHAGDVQRRQRELGVAEQSVKDRAEQLEMLNHDWGAHLSALGLASESAVETIQLIFTKVSAVRDQVATLDNLAERIHRMTASRDSYVALARPLPSLAPHCDGPAAELVSAVDRFFEEVQRQQDRLKERELARRALADERRRISVATEALEKALETLAAVRQRHVGAQDIWRRWLVRHGLAVDLSPATALEALQLVENAVDRLTERQHLDEDIARVQATSVAYEGGAARVFEALQRRLPPAPELPARVEQLGRELGLHKENATRRREMERQVETLSVQIESARRQLDETSQRITALRREGNATDDDTFRERGKWYARRNELCAAIDQAKSTICKISGEIELDKLEAKLTGWSRERLEVRRNEMGLNIEDVENRLNDLRDIKAKLVNRIEVMKTADDVARLRTDQERVLAQIRQLAIQWTRHALAKMLLQQARKKFEEEQQPRVVRDASKFFSAMTCGRYSNLIAPVGADTIEVVTAGAERRKPEQLSRGTTEQLYLALRFGYIRLRAADHERLPVVMDDILVNFDPQRAAQAAAAILDLAREHQTLFFTCHPETVGLFRQHDASLPLYRLQGTTVTVEAP